MDNCVLRTHLSILTGSVLGAALLLAAHRARESVTSFLVSKAQAAAAASPRCGAARASPVRRHHRAPTVRAANRRSEPGHARTPCAFRHSSSCLGCGCTPFGRAPSTRALLGPACKETWDHLRATFALAPFAGRGATMATVVATDATREQHEEQSAVDGSPSAVPTVDSSDAGEPSAAVSNRARRADRRRWLSPPSPPTSTHSLSPTLCDHALSLHPACTPFAPR